MTPRPLAAAALAAALAGWLSRTGVDAQTPGPFRFRTGVALVNVAVTVVDGQGRFVSGLRRDDFRVYEDEEPRAIAHFSAERVPVSLGLVLDTSGSMEGVKIEHARRALERFLFDLLDPADEVFLYRFDSQPELIQDWTTDRARIVRALDRLRPRGGTALYDTVAEAIPRAQAGRHRKKALVIISDGNDTASRTEVGELVRLIRQTEVLVYAVGIDGDATPTLGGSLPIPRPPRLPVPFPIPGGGRRFPPTVPRVPSGGGATRHGGERVNVAALRAITDESGGRTEVIREARDLDPATAGVADELTRQYFLGYESPAVRDGRWHSIRVEVTRGRYLVRARRGYVATP